VDDNFPFILKAGVPSGFLAEKIGEKLTFSQIASGILNKLCDFSVTFKCVQVIFFFEAPTW
jgi:hypothetical protein